MITVLVDFKLDLRMVKTYWIPSTDDKTFSNRIYFFIRRVFKNQKFIWECDCTLRTFISKVVVDVKSLSEFV